MTTSAESRRSAILDHLSRERFLKVADLSRSFGVSQVSIHRDLCQLEEQGLLQRVHGGLIASPLLRLGIQISAVVIAQMVEDRAEKEQIARDAASLVEPGDHLIFDSGVISYLTACALSGDLLTQGELTVITASLPVAIELAPWPGVELILLGGEYQSDGMMNLTGPSTLRSLEGLHADKMFLTAEKVDVQHGVAISSGELELVNKMISASSALIVLVVGSKLGQVGEHRAVPIGGVHTLVTNQGSSGEVIALLRSQEIHVILAQPRLRKPLCQ